MISHGCVIDGTVEHSVLSPGVRVARGAVVRDSIVMFDAVIEADEPLYLWVANDNPRAHRFYQRNGFTLDGAEHTEPFLGETLTEVRFVR